tara:strand:- start:113 stop:1306 length:1194 start_codon:yes stop_codon:yes gene_type:complete
MNITIPKLLKTALSLFISFILFLSVTIIAFYFLLQDGVEFDLDRSNKTLNDLSKRFEIEFDNDSSISFKANNKEINTYLVLNSAIIRRFGNKLIDSKNISLTTSLDFKNTLLFTSQLILNNKTELNLFSPVKINVKEADLYVNNIQNEDEILSEVEKDYFPVVINFEDGKLFDDSIFLGSFNLNLNINQYQKRSDIKSYKIRLKSSETFPASYIAQFFNDVERIGDDKESVSFDITLEDKSFLSGSNSSVLNGIIQIRNTTMRLKKFPVELKPEPIRRLNFDLNIIDNVAQASLIGTVYNPKKNLGLQTKPNLQIGGTINFEEILKPNLNLIVNGYDIYFAKLENLNLNGVTDLTVSIIGKNVLDLSGSLKIKKSSGFLVPLKDTEFETKHRIREEK